MFGLHSEHLSIPNTIVDTRKARQLRWYTSRIGVPRFRVLGSVNFQKFEGMKHQMLPSNLPSKNI